jgi:uncharacterized SAM-binding protein YcdF (DUF218 family)
VSDRLIVVFGYSRRSSLELHRICADRLERAEREAGTDDVVLLSGWARSRSATSEAELMARSWAGREGSVVLDSRARTTLGNVVGAAKLARALPAREVVVVTSSWHAPRAAVLMRWALRGTGSTVRIAATDERCSVGGRLRELACWAVVPLSALAVWVGSGAAALD